MTVTIQITTEPDAHSIHSASGSSFSARGSEALFSVVRKGAETCTATYLPRQATRAIALSEAAAKNHLLSDATATTKIGLPERHGPCSARMPALHLLLQQERRKAVATNTLRAKSLVSRLPVLSEQSCEPNKAGNGFAASWKAPSRSGGATQSAPGLTRNWPASSRLGCYPNNFGEGEAA